jgi:tetratricopeptide (TPR) repeat protein
LKLRAFKVEVKRFTSAVVATIFVLGCSKEPSEKNMSQADEFLRQGQNMRAIEEYSRVVNFEQRSALAIRAQNQIAKIYENNLKDYTMAIRAYRDVFRRAVEDRQRLEARLAIARIYDIKLEKPGIAIEEYQALYSEFGNSHKEGPEILLSLAKNLVAVGRYTDAVKHYEEFRKDFPGHRDGPRARFFFGQAYVCAARD